MSDKWLTVSQAATQLGMSERQARRYAAKLAPEDKDNTPDMTSDSAPDTGIQKEGHEGGPRPARSPTLVRLGAMQAARDEATKRGNPHLAPQIAADALTDTTDHATRATLDIFTKEPDAAPDTHAQHAGHAIGRATADTSGVAPAAPSDWQHRAAEYKQEIQFLRATVEQHQRSEAELRAALRKALEATPRQLTRGDEPAAPISSALPDVSSPHVSSPQSHVVASAVVTHPTAPRAPAQTRQTQKHRAVRELLRAFLGIGGGEE